MSDHQRPGYFTGRGIGGARWPHRPHRASRPSAATAGLPGVLSTDAVAAWLREQARLRPPTPMRYQTIEQRSAKDRREVAAATQAILDLAASLRGWETRG